jgi:hypothetical protein
MSTLVCLGFGYCARHFAAEFGPRFTRVVGTTRDPDKIAGAAIELLMFGAHPSALLRRAIAEASHLLISAAPGETGDPVLLALGRDIAAAPHLRSVV